MCRVCADVTDGQRSLFVVIFSSATVKPINVVLCVHIRWIKEIYGTREQIKKLVQIYVNDQSARSAIRFLRNHVQKRIAKLHRMVCAER